MSKIPSHKDKNQKKQKTYQATAKNFKAVVEQAIRENQPDPEVLNPAFSFQYLNQDNFSRGTWDDQLALMGTMRHLSQLTWKEIHTLHRHKLGFEIIPRKNLKIPIPSEIGSAVRFMVFRFSGLKSVIGFRQGGVFFILWLDYDFSAYDHT